jgi:hypothetical protein
MLAVRGKPFLPPQFKTQLILIEDFPKEKLSYLNQYIFCQHSIYASQFSYGKRFNRSGKTVCLDLATAAKVSSSENKKKSIKASFNLLINL